LGFSSRWTPSMSLCGVDCGGLAKGSLLLSRSTGGAAAKLRKKS
jgi:hypothetical protein